MKSVKKAIFNILILGLFGLTLTSCASTMNYKEPLYLYSSDNLSEAFNVITNNEDAYLKEDGSIIYGLNAGMVAHAANKPIESNSYFTIAEEAINASYTQSISKNVASYLVSENTRSYDSPNYEDIYTNLFKSLNYYKSGNTEDAMVEIRRMNDKISYYQNETPLKEDNRVKYDSFKYNKVTYPPLTNSGLAQYLSSLFSYEYGDKNYFKVSLKKIDNALKTESVFYNQKEYKTINTLKTLDKNKTIVSFLSFTGLAPQKTETSSLNALLLTSYTDQEGNFHRAIHNNIVYSVPMVRTSQVKRVRVNIDGINYTMEAFENINKIAFSSMIKKSKVEYSRAFIRILTREMSKALVTVTAKDEGERTFASFFSIGMNIFTAVNERADIRCSLFFPGLSWISCIEIEPGVHNIRVEFLNSSGKIIDSRFYKNYEVIKGKANLIENISPK